VESGVVNTGCEMRDVRCAMQDSGYGMRDTRRRIGAWLTSFTTRTSNPVSRVPYLVSLPAALLFFILGMPAHAEAHLVNTGLGPFYDGVSHLFIAPEDLLAVLALGMLAGLGGPLYGRAVLFTLTGAWMVGGLAGLTQTTEVGFPLAAMISFLVAGALVALGRKLPIGAVIGFAALLGLLHGFLNGTAMVSSNLGWLGLVGVSAAVFVVVALVAALVVRLQCAWARIGVRVAGSWIVAVGLLMVGWSVREM
jgi:hydrogenase/urease accessory protein HupE